MQSLGGAPTRRHVLEQLVPCVLDMTQSAMDRLRCMPYSSAMSHSQGLHAQAYPKDRDLHFCLEQLLADSCSGRHLVLQLALDARGVSIHAEVSLPMLLQ